ncbi:Transcription factor [Penicillium riverlandense]|uniref:Transcription factor n=1 Tax=Penicillium riverlandense TaxID=1903569 RepID=UPI002546E05C|nr:Transcription factor [Penicillium riverlandense]KAJ5833665.1 Transcription factor [Penicillium riverlandense]
MDRALHRLRAGSFPVIAVNVGWGGQPVRVARPGSRGCTKSGASCDLQNIRGEDLVVAKYVQSLENKVADLEMQLQRHQPTRAEQPDARFPPGGLPGRISIGDVQVNSLCFDLPNTSSFANSSQFGLHLALNLSDVAQASTVSKAGTTSPQSTGDFHSQDDRSDTSPSSGNYPFTAVMDNHAEGAGPPPEELGTKLIETYSERLDWRYPFLDLDQIVELHQEREILSRVEPQSLTANQRFGLFKLYLVYAVGSGLLALTEKQTSSPTPEAFYATAIQHISAAREPQSLESIEAMVLLVIFHLRCSLSQELWYLIGFAMRTCVHQGMYLSRREVDLPPTTIQKRRKLFWTVYSLERNISIALGYPVSLPDRLIDVDMPTVMRDDDHKLRQAIHIFQLRRIESRIHHSIYRNDRTLQVLLPKTRGHFQKLQEWKDSIVASVDLYSSRRLDYFLLHYHRATRLLIQPFLSILPSSDPYYNACLESAGQICQIHKRLHQNSDYGHSFIAVQTVFVSGIVLLYCLWTHGSDVWSVRLSNNIRACSSVLFVMGERTPWVRRYRDAFEALVSVTMERLETQQTGTGVGGAGTTEDIPMNDTAVPEVRDTQIRGNSVISNGEFMNGSGSVPGEHMPPPLQVLQDRWMEFDTMAVVNELATWADPDTPSAQIPWTLGYGDFGDCSWEEWQLP